MDSTLVCYVYIKVDSNQLSTNKSLGIKPKDLFA